MRFRSTFLNRILVAFALLTAFTAASRAQAPDPVLAVPQNGGQNIVLDTPAVNVQPGDVLEVSVASQPALTRVVAVSKEGTIRYPYLGSVLVLGLNGPDIETKIATGLKKQIARPQVSVVLVRRPEHYVTVLGSVRTPGKRVLKDGWRIIDLLADCGGLALSPTQATGTEGAEGGATAPVAPGTGRTTTVGPSPDAGSIEIPTGTLVHASGGDPIPVNLNALLTTADPAENIELRPGDVLLVPEPDRTKNRIQVLGEVGRPGFVPAPRDGAILAAITSAGGPTARAALSRAMVFRNNKTIPIDLRQLLSDANASDGFKLEPGDALVLPTTQLQCIVWGAVVRPGAIDYPEGEKLTVVAAITRAGGEAATADLKNVTIVRQADPAAGTKAMPTLVTLNLEDVVRRGDLSKNLTIEPGAIIYVPIKGQKRGFGLTDALNLIPFVGLLAR